MYKSLIITVLPLISLCAMEQDAVKIGNVITPQQLDKIALYHKAQKFYVEKNNQPHEIKSYDVDQKIRNLSPEQLAKFQKIAYFRLNQMNNGDYSLTAHARGLGGGPLTGTIAYWTTKITGCGAIAAAVFFQPHLIYEALHAYEAVEMAAASAGILGTMAPTP